MIGTKEIGIIPSRRAVSLAAHQGARTTAGGRPQAGLPDHEEATDVITASPETSVRDIAALLREKRISGVPVVTSDNTVVGIVSEGDLMRHAEVVGERRHSWWLRLFDHPNALAHEYAKAHGRVARDVMSSDPITVDPAVSLAEIAKILESHRIKRVPVVRDGKRMGIVTRANLLRRRWKLPNRQAWTIVQFVNSF